MDEFLEGDIINNGFYNHFWNIYKNQISVFLTPLDVFNELYYQLTRIYYEKPSSRDYYSYFEDIQKNLGKASNATLASLIMMMIYHHIRIRAPKELKSGNIEMLNTIYEQQSPSMYWNVFQSIPSFTRLPEPAINPQKPSPVSPIELEKKKIDWLKTTRFYDLKAIREIINLWNTKEDRELVAKVIMINLRTTGDPSYRIEKMSVRKFLAQFLNNKKEEPASSRLDKDRTSDDEEFKKAAKFLAEHKKKSEVEEREKEVLQLKKDINSCVNELNRLIKKEKALEKDNSQLKEERDEYKKRVDELEKKVKELEEQHEEDETRMMTGFGALVLEEIEDGKVVRQQLLNTDVNQALAESQRQNKLSQQQLKEMESQIANLRDKLGNATIPLEKLVDGIKEFIQMTSPEKGFDLFMQLSIILQGEPVWVKSSVDLKTYIINIRKENKQPAVKFENAQVTMQQPTINAPLNDIHDNNNVNMGGE